jgi:lipopolysaccharide heptosyltransferase II
LKIAIRFPNWLGDLVMSIGFYNKVKEVFKDAKIYAIVKSEISELLSLFGNFEKVYEFSKSKYNGILGIYNWSKEINEKFDIYFSLPNSFSSALMGYFLRAKERIGYKNEFRSFLLTRAYNKPKNLHRVEEYCYLLKDFTENSLKNINVKLDIEPDESIMKLNSEYKIAININSEAQSRRMSIPKWAKIIEFLKKEIDAYFILTGSKKDIKRVYWLVETLSDKNRIINLAGKTNLIELSKIIKACDLMISTDSGPAHLSNALNIKTIVLFGAGDERNTAPYNKQFLKVIRINLDCSPCLKNKCPLSVPICLENIEETQIINIVKNYLLKK